VWGVLPNIQDKNNREVDKGMDSLKLTVSCAEVRNWYDEMSALTTVVSLAKKGILNDHIEIALNRELSKISENASSHPHGGGHHYTLLSLFCLRVKFL